MVLVSKAKQAAAAKRKQLRKAKAGGAGGGRSGQAAEESEEEDDPEWTGEEFGIDDEEEVEELYDSLRLNPIPEGAG
jgi:hypothetical protein